MRPRQRSTSLYRQLDVQRAQEELARLDQRLERLREEVDTRRSAPSNFDSASALSFETRQQIYQLQLAFAVEMCGYAANNEVAKLEAKLVQGISPNCYDYDDMTPLHLAASRGNAEAVRLLLKNHADTHMVDSQGRTAKELAVAEHHFQIVDIFDEYHATSQRHPPHVTSTMTLSSLDSPAMPISDTFSTMLNAVPHVRPGLGMMSPVPPTGGIFRSNTPSLHSTDSGPDARANTDHGGIALVMMGLPARGKSFVAKKIRQYFAWNDVPVKIFCFRSYRREVCHIDGQVMRLPVTDQDERISRALCTDVSEFLRAKQGIAIIDGTFSTKQRRTTLSDFIVSLCDCDASDVMFLELVITKPETVMRNIETERRTLLAHAKEHGGDTEALGSNFTEKYLDVIAAHEEVYQGLSPETDPTVSFIKVIDRETIVLNQVDGAVGSRIVYLLQNLHRQPTTIYLTCSGESEDDVMRRLGGNSKLTKAGEKFAQNLADYFDEQLAADEPLAVMRSCLLRSLQTCAYLQDRPGTRISEFPTLDEISYGDCDGQTAEEVERALPNTFNLLKDDPYNAAWPNGESVRQLFVSRLEPLIHDMQAKDVPLLIVSHRVVIQGLLSFFGESEPTPAEATFTDVPQHTVFKLSHSGSSKMNIENIFLGPTLANRVTAPSSKPIYSARGDDIDVAVDSMYDDVDVDDVDDDVNAEPLGESLED